jgi:pimeloyl-ACP methyl ester carboxylesterase
MPAQYTLEQFQRSWYVQFFKEETAEDWLLKDDAAMLETFLQFSPDAERYREELTRPGALTAALNWYRANWELPHPDDAESPIPAIEMPVMGVWSEGDDVALREEWMKQSRRIVEGSWRYERVTGTSHWMMLDKPTRINELLIDFLA